MFPLEYNYFNSEARRLCKKNFKKSHGLFESWPASRLWQVAAVEYPSHPHPIPPSRKKTFVQRTWTPPKYPPEAVDVNKNACKLKTSHPHSPNKFSHNPSIPCHNDVSTGRTKWPLTNNKSQTTRHHGMPKKNFHCAVCCEYRISCHTEEIFKPDQPVRSYGDCLLMSGFQSFAWLIGTLSSNMALTPVSRKKSYWGQDKNRIKSLFSAGELSLGVMLLYRNWIIEKPLPNIR